MVDQLTERGLPREMPEAMRKLFENRGEMYWCGSVAKKKENWADTPRYAVITQTGLYLVKSHSKLSRCVLLSDIRAVIKPTQTDVKMVAVLMKGNEAMTDPKDSASMTFPKTYIPNLALTFEMDPREQDKRRDKFTTALSAAYYAATHATLVVRDLDMSSAEDLKTSCKEYRKPKYGETTQKQKQKQKQNAHIYTLRGWVNDPNAGILENGPVPVTPNSPYMQLKQGSSPVGATATDPAAGAAAPPPASTALEMHDGLPPAADRADQEFLQRANSMHAPGGGGIAPSSSHRSPSPPQQHYQQTGYSQAPPYHPQLSTSPSRTYTGHTGQRPPSPRAAVYSDSYTTSRSPQRGQPVSGVYQDGATGVETFTVSPSVGSFKGRGSQLHPGVNPTTLRSHDATLVSPRRFPQPGGVAYAETPATGPFSVAPSQHPYGGAGVPETPPLAAPVYTGQLPQQSQAFSPPLGVGGRGTYVVQPPPNEVVATQYNPAQYSGSHRPSSNIVVV